MPGADLAGATRNDRMRALKASFEKHGIAVQHDIVRSRLIGFLCG